MEFLYIVIQVGGPAAPDDYYKDDRTDYIMAEVIKLHLNLPTHIPLSFALIHNFQVTLDYNAGFQSTVAGLKSLSC